MINLLDKNKYYLIQFTPNGKVYIGATKNYEKRIKGHLMYLRKGLHYNDSLQSAFNKYGETNFTTYVIETNNDLKMETRESELIREFENRRGVFNIRWTDIENPCQMSFTINTDLKKSFQKVVGSKYMSYRLRKIMERIVKQSNKITHA